MSFRYAFHVIAVKVCLECVQNTLECLWCKHKNNGVYTALKNVKFGVRRCLCGL